MAKFGQEQSKRIDGMGNMHDGQGKSRINSVGCHDRLSHDRLSRFDALMAEVPLKMAFS
jgi:hypothetical protein